MAATSGMNTRTPILPSGNACGPSTPNGSLQSPATMESICSSVIPGWSRCSGILGSPGAGSAGMRVHELAHPAYGDREPGRPVVGFVHDLVAGLLQREQVEPVLGDGRIGGVAVDAGNALAVRR